MQKRVLEILHSDHPELADAAWQTIRRGWVFGSDEFCLQVRGAIDQASQGRRRDSHSGGAANLHDEQTAEKLLKSGLSVVGLSCEDLGVIKKSDDRKKVMAWFIRKNTSVKNEWVSKALQVGKTATVSRSVKAVDQAVDGLLCDLKLKVSKIKDLPSRQGLIII